MHMHTIRNSWKAYEGSAHRRDNSNFKRCSHSCMRLRCISNRKVRQQNGLHACLERASPSNPPTDPPQATLNCQGIVRCLATLGLGSTCAIRLPCLLKGRRKPITDPPLLQAYTNIFPRIIHTKGEGDSKPTKRKARVKHENYIELNYHPQTATNLGKGVQGSLA